MNSVTLVLTNDYFKIIKICHTLKTNFAVLMLLFNACASCFAFLNIVTVTVEFSYNSLEWHAYLFRVMLPFCTYLLVFVSDLFFASASSILLSHLSISSMMCQATFLKEIW